MAALDVRFLDRFFDLHVMEAMQVAVSVRWAASDEERGRNGACQRKGWNAPTHGSKGTLPAGPGPRGAEFTLADCAAAPSLFYADWTYQIPEAYPQLRAYRARLLARPSFARAVDEARPYRPFFPLGAPDRD